MQSTKVRGQLAAAWHRSRGSIPPGFSAKLAVVKRIARREVLAQKLLRIAEQPDWTSAQQQFTAFAAGRADDGRAKPLVAAALLSTARKAEGRGWWLTAARLWVWFAGVSGESDKAARNIARCARNLTRERHDRECVTQALQAWRFLLGLDPKSEAAAQGLIWCHATLAGLSEKRGDLASAAAQWSAVLNISPDDEQAKEGLRRTSEEGQEQRLTVDPTQPSPEVQALYRRLCRATGPNYKAQCAAGMSLLQAGAPQLALDFAQSAFDQRRGHEAALLLFRCCMALGKYPQAAAALNASPEAVRVQTVSYDELHHLLSRESVESVSSELLLALAQREDAGLLAPVLLPRLIDRDLREHVLAFTDASHAGQGWPGPVIRRSADYLWELGEQDRALRLLASSSYLPEVAESFLIYALLLEPEQVEKSIGTEWQNARAACSAALLLAELYHRHGKLETAADFLCRITRENGAEQFYRTNKARIGSLISALLTTGPNRVFEGRLAELVAGWATPFSREFFQGSGFSSLQAELASASRFAVAPETSRLGMLREGYFDYHMERRENRPPETYRNNFALCQVAVQYFETMAQMRAREEVPLSGSVRARLGTTTLSFGAASADLLMTYAILRERPNAELVSESLFDELSGWYLREFMPRFKVPGSCVSADLAHALNAVEIDYPVFGVTVTRFASMLWRASESRQNAFDLQNPVDAVLLVLELIAAELPHNPQYRFALGGMMPPRGSSQTFLDRCIAAIAGTSVFPPDASFSGLVNQVAVPPDKRVRPSHDGTPQDVLLIGHDEAGSGLGRNSRMLADALGTSAVRLARLSYDASPEEFTEGLASWLEGCTTRPVVLAAVNAQDIPTLFVKDRRNNLDSCYLIGFFLWETSLAPRVQHLGIRLVNEIWVPTQYVGSVYAPFAPVHVIGKGLFSEVHMNERAPLRVGGTVRFLTVFDFHSSIERKNPLAAVLAFQKAFRSGENVELVVKASNVNPQHPGNAARQWERLCAASEGDPRIRIITERYSEEQMQDLMRQTGCVVSLHRSEGFGYVVSDGMALGIPVVATNYSGNIDFCDAETSFPVDYRLIPVRSHGAHWESDGTEWADPDVDSAAAQMAAVYRDYRAALAKADVARTSILKKYSTATFAETLRTRLSAIQHPGVDPVSNTVH